MLVQIVIVANLVIVSLNLYLMWQICKLRKCLGKTAYFLSELEANFAIILQESPSLIIETAWEIYQFRNKYRLLQQRNQQFKQILFLIKTSYRIWQSKFI
jgi:hypothetical protein